MGVRADGWAADAARLMCGVAAPAPPGGTGDAGTGERRPAAERVPVSLGPLGLVGAIDIWIIPGLLLGTPGLLLIAFVALQAIGALAWVPAIRRLRDAGPEPD